METLLIGCTSGCTSVFLIKVNPTSDVSLQKDMHKSKHSKIYGKYVFGNVDRICATYL